MSVFDPDTLAAVRHDLVIGVRAGDSHRFTPVWSVVVEGRVFIRSWGLSDTSWFTHFREDPRGDVQIAGREWPVRAAITRNEHLRDAVDEAYRLKYHTAASAVYVGDLTSEPSRRTTTELVPLGPG